MNLAIIVAAFLFLLAALRPLFGWNMGKFDPIAWGLFAFALGHIWTYVIPTNRQQ